MLTVPRLRLCTSWPTMHGKGKLSSARHCWQLAMEESAVYYSPSLQRMRQAAGKVRKCTLRTAMRNVRSQDPPLQILTATILCFSSCGRAKQTYAQATVGQDILLNFAAGLFRTAA